MFHILGSKNLQGRGGLSLILPSFTLNLDIAVSIQAMAKSDDG